MATTSTSTPVSSSLPTTSARTEAGVTHIDLNFSTAMTKGGGTIFVTDGAVQTVIDRVTGQPKLRVVGATFTKEIALDQVHISGTHVMFDATGLPPGAALNIYMGAGTLASSGKALAGITVPGSASFTTPDVVVEPPPPLLEASIALQDKTLTAGADITVTVTFSKALATLDLAAIAAEHASVKDIAHSLDGRTWTITLGASDSVDSLSNVLRLDMAQVVSSDGTRGSGILTSSPYVVDTDAPDVVGSPNAVTDFALDANIVVAFDQAIYWATEEGDADMLYLRGDNGAIIEIYLDESNFSEGEGGTVLTITPAEHRMQAGVEYTLVLPENLMDIAGNPVAGYEIIFTTAGGGGGDEDTTAPGAVKVFVEGDGYYGVGDTVTFRIRFDETIQMASDAIVSIGLTGGRTATLDRVSGDELVFEYTVVATDNVSDLEVTDLSQLVDNVEDLAGNPLASAHLEYAGVYSESGYGSAIDVVLDTTAPGAPAAPTLALESDGGAAGDGITNDATPTLTGVVEANATVELFDGTTSLGTTTANGSGVWSMTLGSVTALEDGVHNLTIKQVDRAGNSSVASAPLALTIDTSLPAALLTPTLLSDTGISSTDGITYERNAVLGGSGAEANGHIKIMRGSDIIGVGTADGGGNWTATVGTPLDEGAHSFTVRQVDAAGNLGAVSTAVNFTVDYTGPAAPPRPNLHTESDTGVSTSDGITSDTTPSFSGIGALPNSVVALYAGALEVGRTTTNGSGNWTITSSVLAEGSHDVSLKQFDAAGNPSTASTAFNLVVDTSGATVALAAPDLDAGSDSGASSSDNLTNDNTPTFTGSGATANTEVALIVGSTEVGRVTADSAGNWSITSTVLADGAHQVRVRQFDKAGNQGTDSDPLTVTIDTAGPTVLGFDTSRSLKEFKLSFSEKILFHPSGQFDLAENSSILGNFNGNSSGNWYTTSGTGGVDSVLNFKISLNGLYNMTMNNDAIQDLAGNVAVIGTRQWFIDLPDGSSS